MIEAFIQWAVSFFHRRGSQQIAQTKKRLKKMGIPHSRFGSYEAYIQSSAWGTISANARRFLNHKCEFCGHPAEAVHHVYYPAITDFGLEDISSLCVVCAKCHRALHGMGADESYLHYFSETAVMCALCKTEKGTQKLPVVIVRGSHHNPVVCHRCESIAMGHREVAYQWSKNQYDAWVVQWQELVFSDFAKQRLRE